MRGIKFSALLLAASLIVSGGLTLATATPAAAETAQVTVHKTNDGIMLTGIARTDGNHVAGTVRAGKRTV
jgi:predicted S18 family serine protease